jgi:hypothetical protein
MYDVRGRVVQLQLFDVTNPMLLFGVFKCDAPLNPPCAAHSLSRVAYGVLGWRNAGDEDRRVEQTGEHRTPC